jgi:hypothetical protein
MHFLSVRLTLADYMRSYFCTARSHSSRSESHGSFSQLPATLRRIHWQHRSGFFLSNICVISFFCKSHNALLHLQSCIWRVTASSLMSSHLPNLPSEIQTVRHCFCCNLLAIFSRQSHLTTCSAFTAGVFAPSSLFPARIRWILTRNRPLPVKTPTCRISLAEKILASRHCLYHQLSHRRRQCHPLLPPLYTTTPMVHAGN